MTAEAPLPAAGWYPDPEVAGTQRYWDGSAWTDNRAPLNVEPEDRGMGALIFFGYLTALLLPIVGFVLGVVLMIRRQTGHGLVVALLSVAVGLAACAILTNEAEEDLRQGVQEFREDTRAYEDCLEETNYKLRQCEYLIE
jgi:hypothetical protein